MKKIKYLIIPVFALLFLNACTSVRVVSDYDKDTNFNSFKTYAFYKTGVDKAQISDLDKKRILRAIDTEMSARGFVKSKSPDLLISIFTKEREQVDIYSNYYGRGWGWNPWYWNEPGNGNHISTSTKGSLYIDLIDTKSKQLVWQGRGIGTLSNTQNIAKKEERIKEFVSQILQKYPPIIASN
ncbi:MAG: DUF4136 domain-containing protein [Cellulophaga sp.]